jgi:hypothetical protein
MALSPEWEPLCTNRIGGWEDIRTLLDIFGKSKILLFLQDLSKDCSVDQPVARSLYRLPLLMYRVGQTGWRVKCTHMHARTHGNKMRCPFSVLIATVQLLLLQKATTGNDQKTCLLQAYPQITRRTNLISKFRTFTFTVTVSQNAVAPKVITCFPVQTSLFIAACTSLVA